MNVARRTKHLKALLDIRTGSGAAFVPSDVKRIHLDFARGIEGGHFGPRKFWRQCLPRLKYYNPAISMTVSRNHDQKGPATLSIFFAPSPKSDSPTASPAPTESTTTSTKPSAHEPFDRVESIDMKNVHSEDIWKKFLDVTKAQPYEASAEDKAILREVKQFNERRQIDVARMDRLNRARAEEKAMLDQSRGADS